MADLDKPITTDTYANVLAEIVENTDALAQQLDPAVVTVTNPPTGAIRWSSASGFWEKFNGTSWAALAASYAINISGSSGKWTTGRTITLTGDVAGTSGAFDGSGDLSFATTLATVAANKGGTGQTAYTIGDLLYASGSSALSKLADIATGNALISGGVGAAPSWGKVGLTTHVEGTLALGNGGTGATTASAARTNLGVDAAMPSGTRMLFNQTTAPTGWTKDATAGLNDSALRIVTGTVGAGGTQGFSTAFSGVIVGTVNSGGASTTEATTLTTTQMPAHTHAQTWGSGSALWMGTTGQVSYGGNTSSTGGGGSHTHSTPNHTHTFSGTTNLAVKYVDMIIASKN